VGGRGWRAIEITAGGGTFGWSSRRRAVEGKSAVAENPSKDGGQGGRRKKEKESKVVL